MAADVTRHMGQAGHHTVRSSRTGDALASLAGYLLLAVIIVVLFGPLLTYLAGTVWSAVTGVAGLVQLWHLLKAGQIGPFFGHFTVVSTAIVTGLTCMSFITLTLSLAVLMSGVVSHGMRRAILLPGLLLTIPALAIYLTGAHFTFALLLARTGWPDWIATALLAYSLIDANALGLFMADSRGGGTSRPDRRTTPAANRVVSAVQDVPALVVARAPVALPESASMEQASASVGSGQRDAVATSVTVIPMEQRMKESEIERAENPGTPMVPAAPSKSLAATVGHGDGQTLSRKHVLVVSAQHRHQLHRRAKRRQPKALPKPVRTHYLTTRSPALPFL